MEILGRPVGKQDQYAAAYGGLERLTFAPDGQVAVESLAVTTDTLHDLQEHLCMFFTGYSRNADAILEEQRTQSAGGDTEMIESLHQVESIGRASLDALQQGDTAQFAALMNEHWEHKKRRSSTMSNPAIDRWHELGMENGALGGKLVGAGSGGFLLFYAKDTDQLRRALATEGLTEVRFQFDHDGAVVIVRD
jgi:D-glycero-alpha-D-manno-heptose-7-phosphate kinase